MKKKKINKGKLLCLVIIVISFIGLIYSIFNIIIWKLENNKTKNISKNINDNIIIEDKNNSILDSYNINFKGLEKINSEVVGYIKIDNTNIDSTVVKHSNNDYYLTHSFDKSYNSAGWVFADYKNKLDGTDKNIILFGHSRKDGSMFGTLKKVLTKDWYDKSNNIVFITKDNKYLFEVFSVYKIKAEEYYIKTEFANDKQFNSFINTIKSRSIKNFNVKLDTNDTILTLSTCDDTGEYRIVLHAKIKETIKVK